MKKRVTILILLLLTTGVFSWSHFYYHDKYVELHDKALIMEYKVLDSDVWTMENRQKQQALSQDASYDNISRIRQEAKGAEQRSKIGYWIAIIAGLASAGYLFYFLWFLIYVEMIRKKGYIRLVEMAKKMGESSKLPKS
ncbi:MAG: hypothetical protein U9Q62_03240 [Campylobacterota bacterium]|nr:hypothetical protein [Campylobacterota bacterium]